MLTQYVSCKGCPLRDSQYVPGDGSQFCKMMVIGTAPGPEEEKERIPFVGASSIVRDIFADLGVEVFFTNVLKRRPVVDGKERKPSKQDCWRCGSHLIEELTILKPKVVVTLGQTPLDFFHSRIAPISTVRGLPLKTVRCQVEFKVIPTFDPLFVSRRGGLLSDVGDKWISDLETATEIFDGLR